MANEQIEHNTTTHEKKELKKKLKEEQELLKEKERKKSKRTKNITFILIGIIVLVIIIIPIYKSATKPPLTDDRYPIKEGQIIIEEFSDFQCPACKAAFPIVKQIKETYNDQIVFMYKHLPLPIHKFAFKAAEASECARDQGKFWEYHDLLFNNQNALTVQDLKKYASDLNLNEGQFNECLDSESKKSMVEKDLLEAQKRRVQGTPTFFINGKKLTGAQPFENFKKIIEGKL